jgi:hypothetical protein
LFITVGSVFIATGVVTGINLISIIGICCFVALVYLYQLKPPDPPSTITMPEKTYKVYPVIRPDTLTMGITVAITPVPNATYYTASTISGLTRVSITSPSSVMTLPSLEVDDYGIVVTASNTFGTSLPSTYTFYKKDFMPDAPTISTVFPLSLPQNPTLTNYGTPGLTVIVTPVPHATHYTATILSGPTKISVTSSSTTLTLTPLAQGDYGIVVTASSIIGTSVPSSVFSYEYRIKEFTLDIVNIPPNSNNDYVIYTDRKAYVDPDTSVLTPRPKIITYTSSFIANGGAILKLSPLESNTFYYISQSISEHITNSLYVFGTRDNSGNSLPSYIQIGPFSNHYGDTKDITVIVTKYSCFGKGVVIQQIFKDITLYQVEVINKPDNKSITLELYKDNTVTYTVSLNNTPPVIMSNTSSYTWSSLTIQTYTIKIKIDSPGYNTEVTLDPIVLTNQIYPAIASYPLDLTDTVNKLKYGGDGIYIKVKHTVPEFKFLGLETYYYQDNTIMNTLPYVDIKDVDIPSCAILPLHSINTNVTSNHVYFTYFNARIHHQILIKINIEDWTNTGITNKKGTYTVVPSTILKDITVDIVGDNNTTC